MLDFIQAKIDDNCTLTLENLQAQVRDQFGLLVSPSTIDRGIDSFRYSVKRIQKIAIAADTPENEAKRIEVALWFIQKTLEHRELIKVDETGFNLSMREAEGRSKIGERAQLRVPAIRSRNVFCSFFL